MDTPPLVKATSATVGLIPQLGLDGSIQIVVIIKQLFYVDRRDRVSRLPGAEVRLSDVPWDEEQPETSSVKLPSDVCLRKPSTDVVVAGQAVAAYRPKQTQLDVFVQVGPVKKLLRVFGPRVWSKGLGSLLTPSPPQPFESLSLQWEYAFGGADGSDPKKLLEEPRNPVGCGLARDGDSLLDKPAPRIEDPTDLITTHKTRPAPAGVAPLGRHWAPRRRYVGTTDETWMKERMPLLPHDFDERYNQVATPELITPTYLRGGEPVNIVNMNEQGDLKFDLPRVAFFVGARGDDGLREHRAPLDTVLLLPNRRTFELTWRAAVPLPSPARKLGLIRVHEKEVL
jgi:hypothetical protein